MNAYHSHLLTLVRKMYDMDAAYNLEILSPFTTYPHVPPAALIDPAPENRRGAPRRTVAVQNNSYGLQYAPASNAAQARNESTQRVNGNSESPNKRRRLGASAHGAGHTARGEGADTDDYSTPRRGVAALDAEAYRPGGNTASRARTQGRKAREGRTIAQAQVIETGNPAIDGLSISRTGSANMIMQGVEPTVQAPSHKGSTQNGRGRSSHHQSNANPNPQPQPYSIPYNTFNPSIPQPGSRHRNPYEGPSAGYDMTAYPTQANMNPAMDAAYHHQPGLNMNPNLNHMARAEQAAYGGGMGMLIPTQLPPPPGSAHGRPSSGSVSRQQAYDVPPPGRDAGSRVDSTTNSMHISQYGTSTKGSSRNMDLGRNIDSVPKDRDLGRDRETSASGGLVPVPMMTSLPPVNSFSHTASASLSMGHPSTNAAGSSESGHGRSRGYSHSGYGNERYAAMENPNSNMGSSYGSHGMGHQQSASSAPGYSTTSSYGSAVDKGRSDVHPSLVNSKELPPLSTHVRDPSIPSAASVTTGPGSAGGAGLNSGSGVMHASLARDPPYRTNSAGSADRSERDIKNGAPSRPRSGTASGGLPTPYPGAPGKYRDDMGDRDLNSAPERERERDNHSVGSGYGQHPSLHSGSTGMGVRTHPSISHSVQNSRYIYGKDDQFVKAEEYTKRQQMERLDDREREKEMREARAVEYGRDPKDLDAMDVDDKIRAPVRRKNIDDVHSYAIPGSGGTDGGGTEGQIVDEDSRPYCTCGQPSFGQMIGCDDSECEIEWVRVISAYA